jgi:sugar lactone lactonase YvrE
MNMKTKYFFIIALLFLNFAVAQEVSTLTGSTSGFLDGTGTAALFNNPWGMVTDTDGNVYVADELNHKIRKVTPAGVVTTFAGSTQGYQDGNGTSAKFYRPNGLAIDASGNIYVVDCYNHKIRKITPSGDVTTFVGSSQGYVNGNGTAARFNFPQGIAIDSAGNLFVVDGSNYAIRKVTPAADVTVFAGAGTSGFNDGTGSGAKFNVIKAIAIDTATNDMYVTDGHRIRKITSAAVVTAFAGATTNGFVNGTLSAARFNWPEGIAVDTNGAIYIADTINCVIRKITAAGVVSTLAGNTNGIAGSANGTGSAASFYAPKGICFDASRNIYIADSHYGKIRKIEMSTLSVGDFNLTKIAIYPNPVMDVLKIDAEADIQNIQIMDLNGKEVFNQKFSSKSIDINCSSFDAGIYFLRTSSNDSSNKVYKIIKK